MQPSAFRPPPCTGETSRHCSSWHREEAGEPSCTLSEHILEQQNRNFRGSAGISANNRNSGYLPAFRNRCSQTFVIARYTDGRPAPCHLLDGLPDSWVLERDPEGRVVRAQPGVEAGFVRDGTFFTREEAARAARSEQAQPGVERPCTERPLPSCNHPASPGYRFWAK